MITGQHREYSLRQLQHTNTQHILHSQLAVFEWHSAVVTAVLPLLITITTANPHILQVHIHTY
jgi:hypothetical protein